MKFFPRGYHIALNLFRIEYNGSGDVKLHEMFLIYVRMLYNVQSTDGTTTWMFN